MTTDTNKSSTSTLTRSRNYVNIRTAGARTAQWALSISLTHTSQLMLYREIITISVEIHTKHLNTLFFAERRIFNANVSDTLTNQWAL